MLTNLPWQIDVLVIETLLSMVVAMLIIAHRTTRISPTNSALMALWTVTCLLLIVTGGSMTWQHVLYLTLEVAGLGSGLARIARGGWIGNEKSRRRIAAEGLTGRNTLSLILLSIGTIYLLVGGVQ